MRENIDFVIITGGRIDHAFAKSFLVKAEVSAILAADSGMEFCKEADIIPQYIIGDFDSVNPETLRFFEQKQDVVITRLNPVKDDTDTEFAIRYAIAQGAEKITILGGTGSRLDHVLGNVSLLGIGLEENVEITLLDEHNRIRMIDSSLIIEKTEQFGNFVSLIPFGDQVKGLTVRGAKYPLADATLSGFNSLGVSNEITEAYMEISLQEGYLIVIESRD